MAQPPKAQTAVERGYARALANKIARFDDMAYPYAALLWDEVLPLQTLDTQQILAFFQQQQGKTGDAVATLTAAVGAVLFGSGYVLLAFLRADLVERLGWLTEHQLVDAVAVGQLTPGPVFTTATFVGYVLRGPVGAVVATVGIFLPSFLLVAVTAPLIPRVRRSAVAGGFLDGVNVASLGLMAAVSVQLARAAIVDPLTAGIAVASLALLVRFRLNTTWLVLGGALLGIAASAR